MEKCPPGWGGLAAGTGTRRLPRTPEERKSQSPETPATAGVGPASIPKNVPARAGLGPGRSPAAVEEHRFVASEGGQRQNGSLAGDFCVAIQRKVEKFYLFCD